MRRTMLWFLVLGSWFLDLPDLRAGWGTSCAPVRSEAQYSVPSTQYSVPSTPYSVAWGRWRRRRGSGPDVINPAEIAVDPKPMATPAMPAPSAQSPEPIGQPTEERAPTAVEVSAAESSRNLPTGVDWSKFQRRPGDPGKIEERYIVNGEVMPKPDAIRFVEGGGDRLPDDSKLVRLSAIGTPAETKSVTDDLEHAQALAGVKDKVLVQVYDVGNDKTAWAVKRYGFATDGHPSIYMQSPSGQVLARMDHYPGPELMATAIAGAVRKADPSYDPKKDPDPTKPPLSGLPVPLIILGGAAGAALLFKRQ